MRGRCRRSRRARRWARPLATAGVALATIAYLAPPAAAAPIDLLAKKLAQAKALEAKIEAANKRADQLDEQYLDARNAVLTSQHGIEVAARA